MARYTIIVEAERPPQITLGQQIGGAIVKELKEVEVELVSASYWLKKQLICDNNQGQACIDQPGHTRQGFIPSTSCTRYAHHKSKRGRPRAN